jgi:endonuclease YncB( thermonuclease family)
LLSHIVLAILIIAGLALAAPWLPAADKSGASGGRATVIDGDTIEIHGERIRLSGIDAPESGQICRKADGAAWRCGQSAALALADRLANATVRCLGNDHDQYGRRIAVCRVDREDINAWMVQQGLAVAYRHYSIAYIGQEGAARAARRGLWAGRFDLPWEWRKAHQ